jgi:uncharacterized membrane protein
VWIALAIATVLAAGLRLPFLGHQSLWLDEIYTREIVRESSLSGLWRHVEATESTPPLYYALAWLVHARSTVAMRLIPALALTAAVPIGYLAFRRLVGIRVALTTAVMLAVNPMLVWYSTDARSYGLFVLTALLSIWAFSSVLGEGSSRRFGLWVAASVACVWTHYFGVFLIGAEVAVLLVARPEARRRTIGWTVLLGLCVAPLVPLLLAQSGSERAGFIAEIPLYTRFTEAARQFAMGPNVPRAWLEGAGLIVFSLALPAGVWLAWRSHPRSRMLLALAVAVFSAPLVLALLKIEDRFYARNLIAVLPLAAALAAPALLRLRGAPLAIYLVLATIASVWVATNWRYEQADWKGALARAEAIEPAAPIIAVTALSAPVIETYLARRPLASRGLLARRAWIIVEPVRAAGQRALAPAPTPTLPGFTTQRSLQLHGFMLTLADAGQPARIAPGKVAGATIFPGRAGY